MTAQLPEVLSGIPRQNARSAPRVAVAHDYFTQRGGAERVALALHQGFAHGPLVTSVVDPDSTFAEIGRHPTRTSWLQRLRLAVRDPRLMLPLLPSAWSGLRITKADADVVVTSSTGFAHGLRADIPKIVYCHNPPRWLYQQDDYLLGQPWPVRTMLRALAPYLRRWDQRAAQSATRYLANSTAVAGRIKTAYGIDAAVVHPPVSMDVNAVQEAVPAAGEPGFLLVVSRARGYKNTAVACEAVRRLPGRRLVVVGGLPPAPAGGWGERIVGVTDMTDAQLRWLYANASALVAPSYEDFGLTPVEAAAFGTPTVALRAGGYLDTVVDGVTGVFADTLTPEAFAGAVVELEQRTLDPEVIAAHARGFSRERFMAQMTEHVAAVVAEAAAQG